MSALLLVSELRPVSQVRRWMAPTSSTRSATGEPWVWVYVCVVVVVCVCVCVGGVTGSLFVMVHAGNFPGVRAGAATGARPVRWEQRWEINRKRERKGGLVCVCVEGPLASVLCLSHF